MAVVNLNLRYRTEGRIRSKFRLITSQHQNPLGIEQTTVCSCLPARAGSFETWVSNRRRLMPSKGPLGREFEGRNPQGLLHAEACFGGSQHASQSLFILMRSVKIQKRLLCQSNKAFGIVVARS